jgi:hypothetical protein
MPSGYKHGLRYTPEYRAWLNLRNRCNNPNSKDYEYYGGRGITCCDEWNSPVQFVLDIGPRPTKHHEIDRIDNNQGYFKENCHWVLRTPQMRNTRISKIWFVYGVRYESLSEAAVIFKTTPTRIKSWCEGRCDGGYIYGPRNNCWSERRYPCE